MRVMMIIKPQNAELNAAMKNGTASSILNRILEESRPEAAYFTTDQGQRTAMLVVNIEDPSQMPRLAAPWYLNFNACVDFKIVMTPEDLRKAGIDELGRRWS